MTDTVAGVRRGAGSARSGKSERKVEHLSDLQTLRSRKDDACFNAFRKENQRNRRV